MLNNFTERLQEALAAQYDPGQSTLHEAISYALLGPGKRLRPKLVFVSALSVAPRKDPQIVFTNALPAMLAVEMVHCYSLVHDDLPAMDNDDYRRGRLSCHKKYGEALGILVGDALIADAFHVLTKAHVQPLSQVKELALSIGSSGMVLGQQEDLTMSSHSSWEMWKNTHLLKTGRLFEAACVMGALSADASLKQIDLIREFARAYGVAFQLKDDLGDNSMTVSSFGYEKVEAVLREHVERAMKAAHAIESEHLHLLAKNLLV